MTYCNSPPKVTSIHLLLFLYFK